MTDVATIIIPTLGRRPRHLARALASVKDAVALVVVNGDRYDKALLEELRRRSDIRLLVISEPGVSNARFVGRQNVDTPYFGFLDDDDELLPDAIPVRLNGFHENVDAVVTNGYLDRQGARTMLFQSFNENAGDLASALMHEQWLDSNGGLFRTSRINASLFEDLPDCMEWTMLAFRLALSHNVALLNVPTFVRHTDAAEHPEHAAYFEAGASVLAAMEALTARRDLKVQLRQKRAAALHTCSAAALATGKIMDAWRFHLSSIAAGGMRYVPYTRRLLRF